MSCGTSFLASIVLTRATSHLSNVFPGRLATITIPPTVLSLTYSVVAGESGVNIASQIMSILGVTLQTVEIYTRQAERGRMAVSGMERLGWGEK